MKYLITESQFDNIIFKYLDNQDFIQIDRENRIYFVNSENDEYSQIGYDKSNGWCYIYYKLINEISTFFSLQDSDSEKVIGRWVENTLQMKVTNTKRFGYIIVGACWEYPTNEGYKHLYKKNILALRGWEYPTNEGYKHPIPKNEILAVVENT